MAIVPDQSSTSAPTEADFGANDWLLEEMYEQYTADPNSVDETWAEYFKTHGAPASGGNGAATGQRSRECEEIHVARAKAADRCCRRTANDQVSCIHVFDRL